MDNYKKLTEQIESFSESQWFEDANFVYDLLLEMSSRDRREVVSRLTVLIGHILKCEFHPSSKTRSWKKSIVVQQNELFQIFEESETLKAYANKVLGTAYKNAVKQYSIESGSDLSSIEIKDLDYYLNYESN